MRNMMIAFCSLPGICGSLLRAVFDAIKTTSEPVIVQMCDRGKKTLLHRAAGSGHEAVVWLLLDYASGSEGCRGLPIQLVPSGTQPQLNGTLKHWRFIVVSVKVSATCMQCHREGRYATHTCSYPRFLMVSIKVSATCRVIKKEDTYFHHCTWRRPGKTDIAKFLWNG
jgi:hypothetical protein